MLIFENHSPTKAEIELFSYAGFYKIEDDAEHSKYSPIHTDIKDSFPKMVKVNPESVEYDTFIVFYHKSETIEGKGTFDGKLLNLMTDRMDELGYNY